jgi:hypothetical protein
MSHNCLFDASFHRHLLLIDENAADALRVQGCPFCSGPLHRADYPRIGFGIPRAFDAYYARRFSFCCGHCRRRSTSPSVRFLGPRRYVAFLLILICAQRSGAREKRLARLAMRFHVRLSLTTWKRWRQWWRDSFPLTAFWRQAKGLLTLTEVTCHFPRILLLPVAGASLADRLLRLLGWLTPLTVRAG